MTTSCVYKPCKNNANCLDITNGYSCHCQNGFHGENCENSEHLILFLSNLCQKPFQEKFNQFWNQFGSSKELHISHTSETLACMVETKRESKWRESSGGAKEERECPIQASFMFSAQMLLPRRSFLRAVLLNERMEETDYRDVWSGSPDQVHGN